MRKGLFLFADYYDATTSSRRVLKSAKTVFDEIEFMYWARLGKERVSNDEIFDNVKFKAFKKTSAPRSFGVLILFISFQYWIFKNLIKRKPNFIVAFTFFTIAPALVYKYLLNRKCKVIYDPRDYVSVSFRINRLVAFTLKLIDNIYIKLSNFVIFPDRQYFKHYGLMSLDEEKCLILPNSAEDMFETIKNIDIFTKYNIPKNKKIIPILGYFSETRGEEIIFELIKEKHEDLFFVFAGDIRDKRYLDFFDQNTDNVKYLNKIPYLDALKIMEEAILVPQLYDPQLLNNVYAFPTKYYDCLMVGTPIVVSDGQIDVAEEIDKNNFGWVIDYSDTKRLREIIFAYIKSPESINRGDLRKYFLENYDYKLFMPKLRDVYKKFSQGN
ncbi:glycosyltransferase [Chryseobacterium sp.]|uniref:glycosyltransferase n=1 Tax=Chryseobacterium sp. TaxID=1871047 RepID=UPI000EBD8F91|nr:glycosyltransferase [Chryseobacterium sp.]HCA07578.1 hypothetical protein [Chryseobacterium sp.]